jgi:hypothetical protein
MVGGSARRKDAAYIKKNTNIEIHASSGSRTHDPSVRAGEDGSSFRPRGHCDRTFINLTKPVNTFCEKKHEIFSVKAGGSYSFHCVLKGLTLQILRFKLTFNTLRHK